MNDQNIYSQQPKTHAGDFDEFLHHSCTQWAYMIHPHTCRASKVANYPKIVYLRFHLRIVVPLKCFALIFASLPRNSAVAMIIDFEMVWKGEKAKKQTNKIFSQVLPIVSIKWTIYIHRRLKTPNGRFHSNYLLKYKVVWFWWYTTLT